MRTPAVWHLDMRPIFKHLDCEIADDVTAVADSLKCYDVSPHNDEPTAELKRREEEAREQLALDLTLSSDILSPQPLLKPTPVDDTLETMTESLSLGSEPAPVEFQYLHPVLKRDTYRQEEPSICPVGVRLLMKDWNIGTDPDQFSYESPYGFKKEVPNSVVKEQPVIVSQPPPVVAASKNNTALTSRKLASESQRSFAIPFSASQPLEQSEDGIHSQEPMTSTQILPGPFGGRTSTKKKPQKKRMGGF